MTKDEPRAVLDELRKMAAEQGWTQVTGYLAQVEILDRQILVACAPGVPADSLAAWLQGRDVAATVTTAELDALAADPGPALAADRVVITLRCGDLLMPTTIAGAAAVMGRPPGSYAVVLTGAERIRDESDLAAVMRAAGGALLGQQGAAHRAGRGLLLWTEDAVPAFLTERVDEDATSLAQWLMSTPGRSAELITQRMAHALALATEAEEAGHTAAAARAADRAAAQGRQLPALRTAVAGLHRRVLGHLDAAAASLTRELTASLDTMRHDLLSAIRSQDGSQDQRSVESMVTRRMARWSDDAGQLIRTRQAQSQRHATELLDVIDWTLVNDVARADNGRRYPDPIVRSFAPGQPGVPAHRGGFALPSSSPPPGAAWAPVLRTATVGGVVTAAALAVLGVAVAPAVGAAAVGVAAATVFGARLNPAAGRRRAEMTAVDAAIRDELAGLMSVLSAELQASSGHVRAAADAEFTALERTLAAAEEQAARPQDSPAGPDPAGPDPAVAGRLAQLRARLGAGDPAPADLAAFPIDHA
jgi:hypothetical protein